MKISVKNTKSVVSPWILIVGVLVIWVLGVVLGNVINVVTSKFVEGDEGRNFWIVLTYIIVAVLLGLGLAFLLTHIVMNVINDINVNINKIAEGDFTARLAPITKNPHINSAVYNFNEMVKQLNSVAVLKNDFVSNFTHEFKTPIASIKGYAELLENGDNLTKEQKDYLRIIIEESKSLSVLAENTMKLARLDSQTTTGNIKNFSLDGQIEDCVLLFDNKLKEKGIELETNLIPARIKNDPYLIKEVWVNLISNAIKFTGKGGKIAITLSRTKGGYLVKIKDNGKGMSEDALKHLYEKFYQEDKNYGDKGLGLGLAIVKRILEIVGGKIECESEIGKGSTFTVHIYHQK